MKSKEEIMKFRNLDKKEILSKILDLKKDLMNLRFQHATANLKNSSLIGKTKKSIAMLKGFLTNKNEKKVK